MKLKPIVINALLIFTAFLTIMLFAKLRPNFILVNSS